MVSTKTFDNIDKEKIYKDLDIDKILNSLSKDIEKIESELIRKAVVNLIHDYDRLKVEFTLFFIVQMIVNILLCLAIVLK